MKVGQLVNISPYLVPSGIYEYDGTLGEYGGYVIPYSYTFSSQH